MLSSGAVRQTLKFKDLTDMNIPIPPKSFQNSFKNDHQMKKYLKLAINSYEPYIKINPDWKQVKLIDYFDLCKGDQPIEKANPGKYTLVTTGENFESVDRFQFNGEAICVPLISSAGHGKATLNRIYYIKGKFAVGNILVALLPKNNKVITKFYYYLFSQEKDTLFTNLMYGTSNVSFKIDDCSEIKIPLPSRAEQEQLLEKIESEKSDIEHNDEIINALDKKITDKISEVLGN